jgi:inosine-uridine nucleoside N-ribohydrolase
VETFLWVKVNTLLKFLLHINLVVTPTGSYFKGLKNAQTLVRLMKQQEKILIHAGADGPLVDIIYPSTPWPGHGKDGLGNHQETYARDILKNETEATISDEHAALALIRYAREHKGELEIHCLAPLT